jgi:dihydropteroate synthase
MMLHTKSKTLDLTQPVVMGILNATPDSFFNKGQSSDALSLLGIAEKMLKDGASILDIGGASTKPGQDWVSSDEELKRVMPVIEAIVKQFPDTWLSIDTYNAAVAKAAVEAGVSIVNDVTSGTHDIAMIPTVAALGVPFIIMHMQGTPKTMQLDPVYTDVFADVKVFLQKAIAQCESAGIKEVIVDPGFGFGKTVEHNYTLLQLTRALSLLGKPVLAGLSRKSMICKPLHLNPEHALNGTTAINMVALQAGAKILRVHDVKEAVEVIQLYKCLEPVTD